MALLHVFVFVSIHSAICTLLRYYPTLERALEIESDFAFERVVPPLLSLYGLATS